MINQKPQHKFFEKYLQNDLSGLTKYLLRVEKDLYDAKGIYGSINKGSIALMIAGTVVGWGFVTNTFASWLSWQGYFLGVIGGKEGPWAFANVGVIFALIIGFIGHLLLSFRKIQAQENTLS